MLSTEPGPLWDEITRAEEYRRSKLGHRDRLIQEFHGPYWGPSGETGNSADNHTYEFVTNMAPRMVFNNPRVNVRSRRSTAPHRLAAEAVRRGCERWIADSSVRDTLRYLATDMLMGWGIAMVTTDDRPDITPPEEVDVKEFRWPVVTRLSPDHVYFDPGAHSFGECRFVGHKYRADIDDVIEMARENEDGTWDLQVAKDLQPTGGDATGEFRTQADTPDRKQVWIYEVWIGEDPHTEEGNEGGKGRIHTVVIGAEDNKPRTLREPYDYIGPDTGPYVMFGAYYVPDHSAPLSPLVATAPQSEDTDLIARAISAGAKAFKTVVLANGSKIAGIVNSGGDKYVFNVGQKLDNDMVRELNIGGVQNEQITAYQLAREKLQRISGLSDAMRGDAGGDNTATAEQIAFQSSNVRVDFIRQAFEGSTTELLTKVCWFLFDDDSVAFPLSVDGGRGDEGELWFRGGPTAGVDMSFNDLELIIEPYSMERTNDSLRMRRLTDVARVTMEMGTMMPQMPHVRWKEVVRDFGDAWNVPDMESRFNWDILEQYWAMNGIPAQANEALPAAGLGKHTGREAPDTNIQPAGARSGRETQMQEKG